MAGTSAGASEPVGQEIGQLAGVTAAKRALNMKNNSSSASGSARRPLAEIPPHAHNRSSACGPPPTLQTRPQTPAGGEPSCPGGNGKGPCERRAYQAPATSPVPAEDVAAPAAPPPAKPRAASLGGEAQGGGAVVHGGGWQQAELVEENARLKAQVVEVGRELEEALMKNHNLELERGDLELKRKRTGERVMELAERCGHLEDESAILVEGLRIKDMRIAGLEHELDLLRREAFEDNSGLLTAGQIIRATSAGEIRHVLEPVSEESEWVSPQKWASPSRPSPSHQSPVHQSPNGGQSPSGSACADSPQSIGGFYPGPTDCSYRCSTSHQDFDPETGLGAAGGKSEFGTMREAAKMAWTSSKVSLGCLLVAVGYNYLSELYLRDHDYV